MIEVHKMMEDLGPTERHQSNSSMGKHFYPYEMKQNNNLHDDDQHLQGHSCYCNIDSNSDNHVTESPPVFPKDSEQLFTVKRYDNGVAENGSAKINDRRDSGFHTMVRPEKEVGIEKPAKTGNLQTDQHNGLNELDITLNDPNLMDGSKNLFVPSPHLRSSPILVRKPQQTAVQLAAKLYHLEGYEKDEISPHLSKNDDYSKAVAIHYMEFFDFTEKTLDEALRMIFKQFVLLGETQERERILFCFSKRFVQCNPNFLDGQPDTVHKLVCAVALLNTDLHLANGSRQRMTSKQFINNLNGMGPNSGNYPNQLLKDLYRAIKKRSLPWSGNGNSVKGSKQVNRKVVSKSPSMMKPKPNNVVARSRSAIRTSRDAIRPFPNRNDDVTSMAIGIGRNSKTKTLPKKQGVLWRKPIMENDGVRTIKRKRKWKLIVVALQGLELHLAKKDSSQADKISIHHSLAQNEAAGESTKRDRVFRVVFANRSACLFQASTDEETQQWIDVINRNAALLSAAPLSAGIGSQRKFQRPLLPSAPSTLPLAQQMSQQSKQLVNLRKDLNEMSSDQDEANMSPTEKTYHADKAQYLRYEIVKYEVYTSILGQLQDANRKHRSDLLLICEQMEEPHKEDKINSDSHSLVSVSPSEPGSSAQHPTSITSITQSDSIGNLVDPLARKHSKPNPVRPILSPTSSLPNLLPPEATHFPFAPIRSHPAPRHEKFSETSGSSVEFIPTFAEIDVTGNWMKQGESPPSVNTNHSNHVGVQCSPGEHAHYWPNLQANTSGYSTTGRIKTKLPEPTGITPSTSLDRINVTRKTSSDGGRRPSLKHRPLEVVTSLVGSQCSPAPSSDLHRQVLHRNATHPMRGERSTTTNSAPPRVRGRREKHKTSRYSYMQAVNDPSNS